MSKEALADYYEILQVSPRADSETIERVFRHLAKRYHPDNQESGNANRFAEIVEAHTMLSDPEKRATYDVNYERVREARWRLFDQSSASSEIVSDSRIRLGLLSILYVARRNNATDPGVGIMELERLLGVADSALQFHTWYLRENGWIERLAVGTWAITAHGVDKLFELGGPGKAGPYLLKDGAEGEK
jgi:curved DNA-binding protein CbpA